MCNGRPDLLLLFFEANPASARCRNPRQASTQLAIESGRDCRDGIECSPMPFSLTIGDKDKETGLDLFMLVAAAHDALFIIFSEQSHFELH
jgi:hypothetical protein